MKQEEKGFFIFVLREANLESYKTVWLPPLIEWYSKMYGIPEKRLWYWVEKWIGKRVANCGTGISGIWFEIINFKGEYKSLYEEYKQASDNKSLISSAVTEAIAKSLFFADCRASERTKRESFIDIMLEFEAVSGMSVKKATEYFKEGYTLMRIRR